MSSLPKIPEDEYINISSQGLEYILNHVDPQTPEKNFLWTTDYRVELPIRVKKEGSGSEKPYTLIQMWRNSLQKYGNLAALNYEASPNKWVTVNYTQYYNLSVQFAQSLIALGVPQYTAVNIIGFNSVEWAVAFHGSIFGHYLPIGLYTSNGPDACAYIANHSQSQIVFMEDTSHLKKYISVLNDVQIIKHYVIWKGSVPNDLPESLRGKVLTWKQFMTLGKQKYKPTRVEDTIQYRQNAAKPGSCATFIYTSGTTGPPKAVMISHDNYTWVTDVFAKRSGMDQPAKQGKSRCISLLPLSHVAAQLTDLVATVRNGGSVFLTDPSALQGNLVKFLHIARPTTFVVVPRVWQKIEQKIAAIGAQTTGLKRTIADWAKAKAVEGTYAEINGGPTPRFWGLAKKLVFDKIKQNLGLDQCDLFIFSAAPLADSTRRFFLNINIYLSNVYGMSELSGPETLTNPAAFKDFTANEAIKEAGTVLEGLQLSINNPDAQGHGQICLRGRNTFMGYFKNQKQTQETIDSKGFVHSGDVGFVAPNGVLYITGRIKELIITAGGQNVAPVLIQNQISAALPLFANIVVIGDKKKFLTCLFTLRTKAPGVLSDELVSTLKAKGSNATTVKQAVQCPVVKKIIEQGIDAANKKAISNAQKIQRYTILPLQFSVDGGQLTPTLKMKRKIINQKYESEINQMYETAKL